MNPQELGRLISSMQQLHMLGQFTFNAETITALSNVKYDDHGHILVESVDNLLKATGLALIGAGLINMNSPRSIREIQKEYFDVLNLIFAQPFEAMNKRKLTPHVAAEEMVNTPDSFGLLLKIAPVLKQTLQAFWRENSATIHTYLKTSRTLKSLYGGNITPIYAWNTATSLGLYVDTMILPDPVFLTLTTFDIAKPEVFTFYLAKHALNILTYQALALANVETPIVIIAPDPRLLDDPRPWEYIQTSAQEDFTYHFNKITNMSFQDYASVSEYLEKLHKQDKPVAIFVNQDRFLIDAEAPLTVETQLKKHMEDTKRDFHAVELYSIGRVVQTAFLGKFLQINELVFKSRYYGAVPVIEAPTTWRYLLWRYEYDAERSGYAYEGASPEELTITKALSAPDSTLSPLLTNLSSQVLIELREAGALSELRKIISHELNDLDQLSPDNYHIAAKRIVDNIGRAFDEHKKEVLLLQDRRRSFFKFDIAPLLGFAAIEILGTASGNPFLQIAASLISTLGVIPSAPSVLKEWKQLNISKTELARNPVGILMRNEKRGQ